MTENEYTNEQLIDFMYDVMDWRDVVDHPMIYAVIEELKEIQQYRAIGTIEEFKDLKEKSVAKKPTPIDYEKYMDVVTNAKFLRGACWCPNCKHTVLSGVCCGNCGQKLDWSVEGSRYE